MAPTPALAPESSPSALTVQSRPPRSTLRTRRSRWRSMAWWGASGGKEEREGKEEMEEEEEEVMLKMVMVPRQRRGNAVFMIDRTLFL